MKYENLHLPQDNGSGYHLTGRLCFTAVTDDEAVPL